MATNKYQEAWFASAVGRATNPDGVGGFQCVDAFHDYGMAIFGKTWQETSGWGNAKDLFWGPSLNYWHKIVNDVNDPDLIPQRGDVVVYGGTPSWGPNPYGHIAVVLSADADGVDVIQQDGFLQCPMYVGRLKYSEPNAGTVIGWLRPNFDDDAPTPAEPAPAAAGNVRVTGPAGVKRREEPSVSGPERDVFPGDREITLAGFIRTGDPEHEVWFKGGLTGGWMWAGGFTDPSTAGLTDLTPPAAETIASHQRITGPDGATLRASPDKNGDVLSTFLPDRVLDFKGWVHGTMPYPGTHDIWLVGATSGGYVWAGAVTPANEAGLPDLNPKPGPATPVPALPAPPAVKAYDFALDFLQIGTVKVEKIPAHIGNVDVGNFPANPTWNVFHWWGTPPIPFTSPLGEWAREGSFKSPHFQVGDVRIAQIVSLKDRAYHAGREGNSSVGIEVDPRIMDRNADGTATATALKIRANLTALILALGSKYGYRAEAILHRNVPGNNTSCSPIDLAWLYAPLTAPAPAPAAPAPAAPAKPVAVPPVPVPAAPEVTPVIQDFFTRLAAWLIGILYPKGK
jgi:hypothetical protein